MGTEPSRASTAGPSPLRRKIATAAILVSLGIVGVAQRDLKRRPSEQVRGNRLLWRLLSLNALGAIAYFRWGRRPPALEA
jgi:hypothetical protein